MCGKESSENWFLFFVKRLKSLGNWFVKKFCSGELAGIPGGRGRVTCLRQGPDCAAWLLCPLEPMKVRWEPWCKRSRCKSGNEQGLEI